jgi:hypothetical protein
VKNNSETMSDNSESDTHRRDKIYVIDVQDPKKEDESQKQESLEESEEPKPKGNKEEKRSRKQRSQGESGDPNPK